MASPLPRQTIEMVILTTRVTKEDLSDAIFIAQEMHIGENGIFALESWHNTQHKDFAYDVMLDLFITDQRPSGALS